MPSPRAGELREKVHLQHRTLDANGDALGPWDETGASPFRRAKYTWLRGGEGVQAARLQGEQPVLVEVRADSITRTVDNAWRVVDARDGRVFDIKGATLSENRMWMEILAAWDGSNG